MVSSLAFLARGNLFPPLVFLSTSILNSVLFLVLSQHQFFSVWFNLGPLRFGCVYRLAVKLLKKNNIIFCFGMCVHTIMFSLDVDIKLSVFTKNLPFIWNNGIVWRTERENLLFTWTTYIYTKNKIKKYKKNNRRKTRQKKLEMNWKLGSARNLIKEQIKKKQWEIRSIVFSRKSMIKNNY